MSSSSSQHREKVTHHIKSFKSSHKSQLDLTRPELDSNMS